MHEFLDALNVVLAPHSTDVTSVYGRAAPQYDRFRDLWLRLAGQDAEDDMVALLREILVPGQHVLDAGCGTGAMSRQIQVMEPNAMLTLLDLTPAMLNRARDIPGEHIQGDVQALPFPSDSFDVVVSAWVIETVPDPRRAVAEFLRVLTPNGFVLFSFCSLPDGWLSRAGTALLRKAVQHGFAGKFLSREEIPAHDCDRSQIIRFHHGLTTFVVLRKCCSVTPDALPVPMTEVPESSS
jgi:malonyl-CoA O-methyltransferase